ncbi:uncharacterized protein [Prorops nasuta]|uniref:uncharacterized protein isoform X2 n=1 Tax=Prorops nasuta TaxID=863751 RepID=UPI0034CF4E5A
MAGGKSNKGQSQNLDRTHQWLYYRQLHNSAISKIPAGLKFIERCNIEERCAITRSITELEKNIIRLLYSNLDLSHQERALVKLITHLTNESHYVNYENIKTKQQDCLLLIDLDKSSETINEYDAVDVSPTSSDMADSGLETGSVSPHGNTTSEYSSTDFDESQIGEYAFGNENHHKTSSKLKRDVENKSLSDVKTHDTSVSFGNLYNVKDVVGPMKECILDDHSATCSSVDTENQNINSSCTSSEAAEKATSLADDICEYENHVLSDPFCESDCESEENESLEIINSNSFFSITTSAEKGTASCKPEEKIHAKFSADDNSNTKELKCEEKNTKEWSFSNDLQSGKSSSNTRNYYFIDASTLNDDIDVLATNTTNDQYCCGTSQAYLPSSLEYTPSRSGICTDDQFHKFTPLKSTNVETVHERVAEFQRELKLSEHLEPAIEPRKIKRVNSQSDDKVDEDKSLNKESLTVEIKETDSGESTQPSPLPDNNTKLNNNQDKTRNLLITDPNVVKNLIRKNNTSVIVEKCDEDKNSNEEIVRSGLIRENTFELDSNEEKLSTLRQEYERRQGTLVFQNAIPQYSGHRVEGDLFYTPPNNTITPPITDMLNNFTTPVTTEAQLSAKSQVYTPSNYSADSYEERSPKLVVNATNENKYLLRTTIDNTNTVCYPVTKSSSDKMIADYQESDDSDKCSSSLPVTLSSIIGKDTRFDSIKRTKRDEATPIISGGVSSLDYAKVTDSPTLRRKTESTPIVSGGMVMMPSIEPEVKPKPTKMSSSMTAWVVDMSDCKNDLKSLSEKGMSQSYSNSECAKKITKKLNEQEKHNSLGFFVNLKDIDIEPEKENPNVKSLEKKSHSSSKPYCEFYIDISDRNNGPRKKKAETRDEPKKVDTSTDEGKKKNIFSMFIDLNQPNKINESSGNSSRSKVSMRKRVEAENQDISSSTSSTTTLDDKCQEQQVTLEKSKPSVFMFIESDSPVVRRRTLSSSRPAFKRHSWNMEKQQQQQPSNSNGQMAKEIMLRKEHKRAHSLSVDRIDLKKLQAGAQGSSSQSLSDAARAETFSDRKPSVKGVQEQDTRNNNMDTSAEDVFEFDVKDTPPNSHVEVINEELRVSVKRHEYKELPTGSENHNLTASEAKSYEEECSDISAWDKTCTESTETQTRSRKSETFDISSGSGPSPGSDNNDYEVLNGEMSKVPDRPQVVPSVGSKILKTHKSLNETIKKIECELKSTDYAADEFAYESNSVSKVAVTVNGEHKELQSKSSKASCSFVRLSDLDKTVKTIPEISVITEEKASYRMSNSIPETSWIESKLIMPRTNVPTRTLPRKFTSVMSTSLPAKQKSPLDDLTGEEGEGIISESDLSSMQSSIGRSGAEGSTEETETSSFACGKPHNRLGEDLLRMFLEEINPDVTIDVSGRHIRAHKCILSSRCQYFAAILSGSWIENAGNIISLQGYSYNAVHFALCHIYSGESNIPDSISIVELATLADMLCLEGLKEVIGYTLKVKYCHLFHKPCQVCAVGVLECMPLAAAYGLDEVYRKSLRWITRHFVRIWPCKAFATLPRELMEKCYHQHVVHMSAENILQTIMDCDKLLATLPNVRWAEPVFRLVSNLLDTSVKFLSDNFSSVLSNDSFQSLGRELTWNISRLEDNVLASAERLPPDQACRSYTKLHKMLLSVQQSDDQPIKPKWGPLFIDFLKKIQSRVEKCLVRDAARAARCTTWLKMDLELRRRIQELACLVILPHESTKRQSRHSNFVKESKAAAIHSTISRSLDLKRVKMAVSEHSDKTLKQPIGTTQIQKKPLSKPKTDPLNRKIHDKSTVNDPIRPKSWPNKMEVKSRYLEPRNKPILKDIQPLQTDKIIQQRRKIMISSSDSSRTSSPAMKRASEKKTMAAMKLPVKKDVKALSSDSLTEANTSKAALKKDLASKSCGITRPESPTLKQKQADIGLSVDSLAENKKQPIVPKKKVNKMDTSMSADSLMAETTTPKSSILSKFSPTRNRTATKTQVYDRMKKSSPPMQQKNMTTGIRRTPRTLENSTAASRSRAAAVTAYHGSPGLRKNLLDAAKTPDIPSRVLNNTTSRIPSARYVTQSSIAIPNVKKKEASISQDNSESPSKRSSPKSSGTNRPIRSSIVHKKTVNKANDGKVKAKCHNGETPKHLTVGSRSGTFLKDEPTILKRTDMKPAQMNT